MLKQLPTVCVFSLNYFTETITAVHVTTRWILLYVAE